MAGSLFGKARIALQYALTRSGLMSMAPSPFGMFTKSGPDCETPDLEYHVQPLSTDRLGDPLHPFSTITVSVCNLRPTSVGSVHTTPARPEARPDIRLNYLTTPEDRRIAVASIRQARQIMTARALQPNSPEVSYPPEIGQ
jgi:choline dehydrogenase